MMVMMMRAIVRMTMLIMLIRMRVFFFLIRYADSEISTEHKAIFGHEDSVALYICLFFPVLNYDCW